MIHLRIIAPEDLADGAIELLRRCASTTNIVVHRGAAIQPVGDTVSCDVAEEDASYLVVDLRAMGIPERGTVDIERLDASVSSAARDAERQTHGSAADAVIWENVGAKIVDQGFVSWGLLVLFALAGVIASVGILIDSAPIVVGAMAVSPDLLPVCGTCVGIVARRGGLIVQALGTLIVGLALSAVAALLLVLLLRVLGHIDGFHLGDGGLGLLTSVNYETVGIALAAGVAAILAFETNASAGVGVAI